MGYVRKKTGLDLNPLNLVEKAVDTVVDVVNFTVDQIIEPIVNTVVDVVQAALDDPIKTIAQIAAVATKQYWLLPIIAGADVAIKGGDLGDVAKAVAISYVMQEVAQGAGEYAGGAASEAAVEAGWSAANAKLAGEIIGTGAGGAAIAVVTGGDPLEAFLIGGATAGAGAVLGKVSGFGDFAKNNKVAGKAIEAMVVAKLSGGNVSAAVIGSLIATSGLVADTIKEFDPLNGQPGAKFDAAQTAIITNVLTGTASAALSGGDPSRVIQAALMKAGSKAIGEMATEGFKSATSSVSEYFNGAKSKADILDGNISAQNEAYNNYKAYADPLNARVAEQTRLKGVYDAAVAAHNANPTEASRNTANAAGDAFDAYVTKLNKDYAETYSPNIKKYGDQLDKLQQDYAVATGDYEKAMDAFADSTDKLSAVLDPIYLTSNRAFTEALDPNFNADEYREINGLGADVDVYEDYLNRGQLEGLATNDKDQAIIEARNQLKEATGKDIPNYIIERALTTDNANRDTIVKQYAETAIQDNTKSISTREDATNAVLGAYEQAGYSQEQISAKIDSGEATAKANQLLEGQKANVESLRQYATDLGASAGTDSTEYKAAYKDALNAMADYGGYGVTKTGETFATAEYGKLDPDRLLPVSYHSDTGWYRDPVTGEAYYKVVVTGGTQEYLPASEIPEQDISALWAIGNSANPPESGGGSYFGSGSGVSSGMFGGLQLVSVDDATGAKMYSDGSGMTLIAYSDGKGKVINNNMEVELITPEDLAKLMGEVPIAKPPTPAAEVKPVEELTQPEAYNKAKQDALESAQTDLKNSYQTADEVKAAIESFGYKATPQEIQSFVGEKTPDQMKFDVEKYVDPKVVSRAEAKAAYAAIGISKPTKADIDKLVGQYSQIYLNGKAAANLDAARYNSIQQQLDNLNITPTDIEGMRSSLTEAIQTAIDFGLQGDAALQAAISAVAESQQTSKEALLSKLGTSESALKSEFAAGFAGVSQQLNEKYAALTASQKAEVDARVQQGADLGAAMARVQSALEGQIAGVSADLKEAIDINEAAGMSRDAAISKAVDDVATSVGTTRADLLAKLGATEQSLLEKFQAGQDKTQEQIAGVTAEMQAQYETLTAGQKATADALVAQGKTFQEAIDAAQAETAGQIGDLTTEMQAQYASLTDAQKATADALIAQGETTQQAIATAQAETTDLINTKTDAINTRIAELVAQGASQQAATTQAFAEVNEKLGTQGRGPNQSDLDALEQMISGTRSTDLSYDTNNDGRIDGSDLTFLTGIVNGDAGGSGFNAPSGSPWAATGLYGSLADAEAARAQDAANQKAAGEAAAAQAATNEKNAQIRGAGGRAAQAMQQFAGSAPTLIQQATQQVSAPIYGQAVEAFDFGAPLDFNYFNPSKEKQGSQTGGQTTKMASGGYLDDLLGEDMSVDDLLKLLR